LEPQNSLEAIEIIGLCSGNNSNERWRTLRDTLASQCRVTATFQRADGRTLHVRKATRAEPDARAIYQALNLNPAPGGILKLIV